MIIRYNGSGFSQAIQINKNMRFTNYIRIHKGFEMSVTEYEYEYKG